MSILVLSLEILASHSIKHVPAPRVVLGRHEPLQASGKVQPLLTFAERNCESCQVTENTRSGSLPHSGRGSLARCLGTLGTWQDGAARCAYSLTRLTSL